MKKIWKEVNRRVYLKWYAVISIIITALVYWSGDYSWWGALIFGLIFFLLFTGLGYVNHVQDEKQAKYNDNRFADDPDWKKYKKLKKKFNNL